MKLSVAIVAHNEEKNLADCLECLKFADEIVVVLDKTTDRSKEIALKYTNRIIEGSWNIEGARRNIAVNACSGDWILEIDADERVSPALASEILNAIKAPVAVGFTIPIDNYIGNRLVKYGWLRTLCVTKRQSIAPKSAKIYHEDKELHPTCDLKVSQIRTLTNPLIHLVDENISDLLNRFDRYTSRKASDMIAKSKIKGGFFSLLFKFKSRFIKSFIIKRGYKEGVLGILIAALAGLYPVVSYLKTRK